MLVPPHSTAGTRACTSRLCTRWRIQLPPPPPPPHTTVPRTLQAGTSAAAVGGADHSTPSSSQGNTASMRHTSNMPSNSQVQGCRSQPRHHVSCLLGRLPLLLCC